MRTMKAVLCGLIVLALMGALRPAMIQAGDDVPRITKEEAKALLGNPSVVFVDARTDSAWKGSDRRIKSAVRVDQFDLESQAGNFARDTKFIVY